MQFFIYILCLIVTLFVSVDKDNDILGRFHGSLI